MKNKKNIMIFAVLCIAALVGVGCYLLLGTEEKEVNFGQTVIPENICQYTEPVEGEIVAEIHIED